ncbi:metal ABC transporter permease [Megalodesulfovibrio gigas]|uniref:Putative permease component of zinc ABC transporter n=1 Tax=Megalodesulfovibrio gigas (strain ATCC 19364 / DSM 1382 / NCIMB 9332 / VKM B-1759) TaxID=1121448 RepID=T2GFG2_MEGG1|nr:metal ABC transporter permease [Megalodesulfovibrio gigas]AGW14632.1 putative permease component of zinc ABC transporter [Megalodesulfovibrio gigas DSM 1382 = ATCC 19364]
MIDALSYDFMQHALAAAVLASLACGVIGSLVVVNRLVFLAGGIAHAAYGGVGLSFFLGLPVIPTTLGFTLGASLLMGKLTMRRTDQSDTVVGVLWAAGMALGILLLDLSPGYTVDLMSYLFGSIMAVPAEDVLAMAGLNVLLLAVVIYNYQDFLCLSFDREYARTAGVPVDRLHYLLLALLGVSVVMIIQVVGLILVIALLTIPSRLAEYGAKSLAGMMVRASAYAMLFSLAGLWASYSLDVTAGAAIIALAALTFFIVQTLGWLRAVLTRS